jgi:hypothetical protein
MRAFRLCRANFPVYDGEGAPPCWGPLELERHSRPVHERDRSLAVLEILVHLAASLPDRYVLGAADIPDAVAVDTLNETRLPADWSTLDPREQEITRRIGDEWAAEKRSAVLLCPR